MRLLLALLAAFFVNSTLAADNYIQVQGRCQTKVSPDRAMITFTAENQSKNQKEAFAKTNQQINNLKEQIKKLNLEKLELKNSSYTVYPVREYEKEKVVDKGIRVSLSLEVMTSQIERIGETLELASKEGITNVGSLGTFLSQEKNQAEYLKCLDVASDDARAKAKQLAKKLDVGLGQVVRVIESPATVSTPVYHERAMMKSAMSDAGGSPAIEPGTQEFSTTIEVSFGIK